MRRGEKTMPSNILIIDENTQTRNKLQILLEEILQRRDGILCLKHPTTVINQRLEAKIAFCSIDRALGLRGISDLNSAGNIQKIVAYSSSGNNGAPKKTKEAGADSFINSNPFIFKEIKNALKIKRKHS